MGGKGERSRSQLLHCLGAQLSQAKNSKWRENGRQTATGSVCATAGNNSSRCAEASKIALFANPGVLGGLGKNGRHSCSKVQPPTRQAVSRGSGETGLGWPPINVRRQTIFIDCCSEFTACRNFCKSLATASVFENPVDWLPLMILKWERNQFDWIPF